MKNIIIIGNGIAGITAARHIRKLNSNHKITVISAETDYFFSRTALMYVYMGHMKFEHTKPYEDWFWKKNRIDLIKAYVQKINPNKNIVLLDNGVELSYRELIIATGSSPNKFGWAGQNLDGVQGLYSYQDLQLLEKNTSNQKVKKAVIVGGGLIGVELAEMLLSRNINVTFLVRENKFWGNILPKEEGEMIGRHMKEHHVDLRLNTELKEIISDGNGRASKVITHNGEEIDCQLVGLTAGVQPNISFLQDSGIETQRGVLVNEYLQTNFSNIYAIGDCTQLKNPPVGRRPIEAVWYVGRMMGETVARTICGQQLKYQPGKWFNSAKFFDIEYQTYGTVLPELTETQDSFYWEHKNGKICLRLVFNNSSRVLEGINVFGMRFRHKICDNWLNEKASIEQVVTELKDANFDPEFYKEYEQEIINQFNKAQGTDLKLKKRNLLKIFG